ncbi:MAG: alpha-ketoacid dehydrogenase subunit beta [Alphaproteobacteria bacterium]|nr:alpha-ketoacid dehydrogenase subunit beta [Alphaproteobacteria bacterium]
MAARTLTLLQAMNEAFRQEMARDPEIVYVGEDVRAPARGESAGLIDAFGPARVIDMPISEAAMAGVATGAAMAGARPIVAFQVTSLLFPAFDQLVNQAAKLPHMLGGQTHLPVTYIVLGSGARDGRAGQHSDAPHAHLLHAGIKCVMPTTPHDAKGLTIAAIREDDPVAVFVPALAAGRQGPVPEDAYALPLGRGAVRRPGRDVSVIAVGHHVHWVLAAAAELAKTGIELEVWEPLSLLPLDREGLLASVGRTGRAIIVDDGNRTCGFAGELSALLAERCFGRLKAPIKRLTRSDIPIPYSRGIEQTAVPDAGKLKAAVEQVMQWRG